MKILYLLDSYNIYGGTPKKTLDLMNYFSSKSHLYVYDKKYIEYKHLFEETGGYVYEGYFGRNLYLHLKYLLKIIDTNGITLIQTQFTFGEILGGMIKILRPNIKLIIAFVGSSSPTGIKKLLLNLFYSKADSFIFISEYVKKEKSKIFKKILYKRNKIIYNGTKKRENDGNNSIAIQSPAILDIAGLTIIKNINILIDAMEIICKDEKRNFYLYIAGDGPERNNLEQSIIKKELSNNIFLLGYTKNVGQLINDCDIFVHPCYVEGFGIAVAEAMISKKPIIVANSGALPELIDHNKSGLVVDPFNKYSWAKAIINLIDNNVISSEFANNACIKAERNFSIENFINNYENLYKELINEN